MNKKSNSQSQQNTDLVTKLLKTHKDSQTGSICKVAKPRITVLSKRGFYRTGRVVRSAELTNAIVKLNEKTDLFCICQTREFHDYTTPKPKPTTRRKATNRAPKVVKLAPKPMTPITMPKPKPQKSLTDMPKAELIAIIQALVA